MQARWACTTAVVAAIASVTVLAGPSAAPSARAATATSQPPSLVELEQKMGELRVSSLRFSLRTSIAPPPGDREARRFLKFLGIGSQISGEGTTSPAALNLSLGLFGHKLTLRAVAGKTYLYIKELARLDGGRPWVRLGRRGLVELLTVNGHPLRARQKTGGPPLLEPTQAQPSFAGLLKSLRSASEVRELGARIVDGVPVTSFTGTIEPAQLKEQAPAPIVQLPASGSSTIAIEVSLASTGLPVRTVLTESNEGTTISAILDIPAINFPLAIEAPPARRTISLARLRRLEKQARRHRARK